MQFAKLQHDYFASLRAWADQISDLLSEAIHFAELDPQRCANGTYFVRRNRIRVALSSLIDRGRFFFPNLHTKECDQHKERAFRGYRQNVLNSLVDAYQAATRLDYDNATNNPPCREKVVTSKRAFISEIQSILDPARRDKEFSELTRDFTGHINAESGPPD